MNRNQRLILAIAAVVFALALLSTPRVQIIDGTLRAGCRATRVACVPDLRSALLRGVTVLGTAALLWLAAGSSARLGRRQEGREER